MKKLKLLSDFDGVWTNQALEAEHVKIYFAAEAARLADISADYSREHFSKFEQNVRKDPTAYGWAPDGRITAYLDEDPLCVVNAVASYIDQNTEDETAQQYRKSILENGFESLTTFADKCFMGGMSDFREQHAPALIPHADDVFKSLIDLGVEIVIVSNSPEEKIIHWFEQSGIPTNGETHNSLIIRGEAGKQKIGPSQEQIQVSGRGIFVDRPLYRKIIQEEDPDFIIGDVFSLDLSLPSVMRKETDSTFDGKLVLRAHPHTPAWIRENRAEGEIDFVVEDIHELVDIMRKSS